MVPMPLGSCNRSRGGAEGAPVLLILDRRDDPVTPLLSQWTYQVGWSRTGWKAGFAEPQPLGTQQWCSCGMHAASVVGGRYT